jgi:hypothetical protein
MLRQIVNSILECETVKYDLSVSSQAHPLKTYYKSQLNNESNRNQSLKYLNQSLTFDLMKEHSLLFNVYRNLMCKSTSSLRKYKHANAFIFSRNEKSEFKLKKKPYYFIIIYYFTRVDVKRLTYQVPKAFICPTVPFIIEKKIILK